MLAPKTDPHPTGRVRPDGFPVAENVCTVVANSAVNDRYRHLVLAAPPPALQVRAGQFFHLLCPAVGSAQPFLRRPMSVYRVDRANGCIEFLYKVVGAGTQAMAALRPGDTFNALGPLGVGFGLDPAWRNIVVVGRGVGLATLAPLAELAAEGGVGVTAILSASSPDYLMSEELFARNGGTVMTVTDSDGTSAPENVGAIVETLIAARRADALFTCGSNRLMLLLKAIAAQHGIPGQVALEQQMACGLGMCFCCVRSFEVDGEVVARRVCNEGPVFDLREAMSW
jgi:dihydroorotate dehydrogenase electron transfer subunit